VLALVLLEIIYVGEFMRENRPGNDINDDFFAGFAPPGRRRAREAALLIQYQMDFGGSDLQTAQDVISPLSLNEDNAAFARQLVEQAHLHKDASDKLIAAHTHEWDFKRLFSIDVAILRLALGELASSTPATIVINEAVELAKKFGDQASPSFINALLDAVYQKQQEEAP